jgi:secondary thiamine-phosphate synthase enzyme
LAQAYDRAFREVLLIFALSKQFAEGELLLKSGRISLSDVTFAMRMAIRAADVHPLPGSMKSAMDTAMHTQRFEIRTHRRDEMVDITDQVHQAISKSGVAEGTVTVYVPHTTAGVTINENADPDVVHDVLAALDQAIPWQSDVYQHGEGNSAAHAKSSLVGCSKTIPVSGGQMILGTWQAVYFCEFDGPRSRRFLVTVAGL